MPEDGGWGYAICDGGAYNVRNYGPFAGRGIYNAWMMEHCPIDDGPFPSHCDNDVPSIKHDYKWLREPNSENNGGLSSRREK